MTRLECGNFPIRKGGLNGPTCRFRSGVLVPPFPSDAIVQFFSCLVLVPLLALCTGSIIRPYLEPCAAVQSGTSLLQEKSSWTIRNATRAHAHAPTPVSKINVAPKTHTSQKVKSCRALGGSSRGLDATAG
jgi:hypothetical protein